VGRDLHHVMDAIVCSLMTCIGHSETCWPMGQT